MQKAEEELEKAKRDPAGKNMQKAIDDLNAAKAKLEEILRQMREEEIERRLAMLEARFAKMLQMQREVYQGPRCLDKVPKPQRTSTTRSNPPPEHARRTTSSSRWTGPCCC